MKRIWLMAGIVFAAAPAARAQQFQQVGAGLPGPVVWSEGVEVFDANGDGRLDILFANGVGFAGPGGALLPTLLINQTPVGGTITFADETASRIPAGFVQQAKNLVVFDADGDTDEDVVFANAFGNQPTILINNGTGQFTNETATRFPALLLNSFDAGFGDVDNDGDLDLVFADSGPSTFGPPGGMPRLFKNDGTGHFANTPVFTTLSNKEAMQNTHLEDVDDDLDLDLVADGRSLGGQRLYLNDGLGHFTYQPTTLPPGSASTYATGWADLDNDDDLDGFYISLSGFNEGTAQNNVHPSGTLSFTATTATLAGLNGHDDNDVVFLDADNNGFLDPIVGSLGNNKEKLYLNSGTFAAGSFVYQANGFTTLTDSTLDLAVGDFDNDGDYDVVTAQGESGNFTNRVYNNTATIDDVPPRIGQVEPIPARVPLSLIGGAGLPVRARIQDATYKRGRTFVTATLDVAAVKDGVSEASSVPMPAVGGGIHRGSIRLGPRPEGRVGTDVTFSVHAQDPNGNFSDSAPATFRLCGAESHGRAVVKVSALNEPSLAANDFKVAVSGLPPHRSASLLIGTSKAVAAATSDASGAAVFDVDLRQPALAGVQAGETRYAQVAYRDREAVSLSDALEIVFCD